MDKQRQQILEAAKKHQYEIKGLKTFKGMEGMGGFNVTLYREGKRIAFVINEDNGGCFDWQGMSREEESKLKDICKTIEPDTSYPSIPIECDMDIFISVMVGNLEEERDWRRKCKTKTIVLLHSNSEGQYIQYDYPFSPKLAQHIRTKHGTDLKEIVNERYQNVP